MRHRLEPATYRGYGGSYGRVTVERGPVTMPLRHFVLHSPSGFAWGYGGSGPAELARCILIDHFYLVEQAQSDRDVRLPADYHEFKWDVVAEWPWPGDGGASDVVWQLTTDEINDWLLEHALNEEPS